MGLDEGFDTALDAGLEVFGGKPPLPETLETPKTATGSLASVSSAISPIPFKDIKGFYAEFYSPLSVGLPTWDEVFGGTPVPRQTFFDLTPVEARGRSWLIGYDKGESGVEES